jgi:DNA-binding transcriptional LysR family regulator
MDRFESMSAFVAVVQAGSFSTASRRLGAPLASVSRRVAELEEQLGCSTAGAVDAQDHAN